MGLVPLNCPNCGAAIQLDSDREFGFCNYCGTKVMQEKVIVEYKGSISVDGISTLDNLLERANVFLKNGRFEESREYFNKALDINAKCSKAYWGLLLCDFSARSDNELIERAIKLKLHISNDVEYDNAMSYATESEAHKYSELDKVIKSRVGHNGSNIIKNNSNHCAILTVPVKGGFVSADFTLYDDSLVYVSKRKTITYYLKDIESIRNEFCWLIISLRGKSNPVKYPMGGRMKDVVMLVNETNNCINRLR